MTNSEFQWAQVKAPDQLFAAFNELRGKMQAAIIDKKFWQVIPSSVPFVWKPAFFYPGNSFLFTSIIRHCDARRAPSDVRALLSTEGPLASLRTRPTSAEGLSCGTPAMRLRAREAPNDSEHIRFGFCCLINIEALCAAPPGAFAQSPSQMPLSCPVAPPSQGELHKDRAAAVVVAWRGGRAPPGPGSPSPAPRPVARPPQRPAPRRSRARRSRVT